MNRSRVADNAPEATASSWYGLGVLTVVTLFALVDRRVFVLLAEPIKHDLGLTDLQLGLLQGLGLAIFAVVVTYPIGWLADRYDRRNILVGCIVSWCLAVLACGFASNFSHLFMTSALVGAGEAGLLPIVYALIPLLFHGPKRQLANSIYAIVGLLGAGLAIALCGYLIVLVDMARPFLPASLQSLANWRLAFIAAALPGPIFAALLLSVRLPKTSRPGVLPVAAAAPVAVGMAVFLKHNWITVGSFFLGIGCAVMGFAGIATWLPIAAMRQFGASPVEVGNEFGAVTAIAALVGLMFTGWGAPRLAARFGTIMPVVVLAVAGFGGAGSIALILGAASARGLFMIYAVHAIFATSGSMLYPTTLQDMSPAHLRARMASLILVVNFSFGALGAAGVGLASDLLPHHPQSLIKAVVAVGVGGLLASGAFLLICCRHYPATIAAVRAGDASSPRAA